jgi:hypothetical protein
MKPAAEHLKNARENANIVGKDGERILLLAILEVLLDIREIATHPSVWIIPSSADRQ